MARRYHPVLAFTQKPSEMLTSHNRNAAHQSVASASPPYSTQFAARRRSKLVQGEPSRCKFLVLAVASILPLVTILASLALCLTTQRRLNSGAAVQRSLSEEEDEQERSAILEHCLDLEQEFGVQPAVSEYVEEASEAKSRLAAMLYDSAATFERMRAFAPQILQDEAQPPPPKIPRLNEPSPWTSHSEASVGAFWQRHSETALSGVVSALDPDAWTPEDSTVGVGGGVRQSQTAKVEELLGIQWGASTSPVGPSAIYAGNAGGWPPTALSLGRAISGEGGLTPDAWLDDSLALMDKRAFQQMGVGTVLRHPAADASSAASISGMSVSTPNELAGRADLRIPRADVGQAIAVPPIQVESVQHLEHRAEAFGVKSGALDGLSSATVVPATSSGDAKPCEPGDISLHPFVRLPVVNPAGVRRSFNEQFALSVDLKIQSPMDLYTRMRSLFAKASLTTDDAEELMKEAELLANYAATKLTRPYRRFTASYLVRKLSSLFMVFDHLVCTVELLGDKMNAASWWTEFAQQFRTDYSFPEEAMKRRTTALYKVVNRLSSALSIYKTGRRPPFQEIVDLKRIILTSPYKCSQFSHPLWALWIQDDKNFSCSSSDSERRNEAQALDEREVEGK